LQHSRGKPVTVNSRDTAPSPRTWPGRANSVTPCPTPPADPPPMTTSAPWTTCVTWSRPSPAGPPFWLVS